ncbi:uncharacterized protein PADG_11684 [Paracoccidioides brasiliensis Pb18]|uniref:Protein kinase domain-containing protein n=1 Tax=Paracoccidioides brasiliensis (strain Pb18) TaxID=502780 RepID=A0A0A0HUX9_PARBD|nr:uncharacterized protein PADG_11684 [Paracoccidioides brasiliensis Pb18]KGM92148.1 hypothetical protein PADG_11684 [Paracoccidioides brasiliensis Pb18]
MALFTQAEIQLAAERRLKYQGKAKINLDQIQVPLDSDTKKLERLRGIFLKEGCLRLDDRNHVITVSIKAHKHLMDPLSIDLPKPSVPYVEGWVFSIQSHIPPPLTPVTKDCCRNFQAGRVERRQLRPVEQCLRHPPLPGNMEPRTVNLKVLDLLRVGDGCNAQVFNVQVLESHGGRVPRFYGSYSLNIPVDRSEMRTVRLILMEYIPGISMQQANPEKYFSRLALQEIMKSVIDFESRLYEQDILLTDLSPRNVIMVEKPGFDPRRDLLFLDFAGALFGRRRDDPLAIESNLFLGRYISPLLRWDKTMAMQFNDWIDWDWQPWIEAEYAHTAATITPEMRDTYCR